MGEQQIFRPEDMATTSTAVTITAPPSHEEVSEPVAVITLRPTCTQPKKRVVWTEDTVDNENMNKMKSKCCCIYEKPHKFGESDSEDSGDECDHCFGHVERRRTATHVTVAPVPDTQVGPSPEPNTTVILKPEHSAPPERQTPEPDSKV